MYRWVLVYPESGKYLLHHYILPWGTEIKRKKILLAATSQNGVEGAC